MKRLSAGGVGALAFVVLTIVALFVDNGPGGSYSQSDVTNYLKSGHRPSVFIALYLVLLGIAGLTLLMMRLRDSIGDPRRSSVFWGLGVAGVGAVVAGWALHGAVPVAMAYGGKGVAVAPTVTFVFSEAGWIVLSAGLILVGLALLTFVLSPVAVPVWVRWFTLVGAVGAVTAPAFFPLALLLIWALVIGVWLVASEGSTAPQSAAAATA